MSWAWIFSLSLSFSCPRRFEFSVSSIVGGSSFSSEIDPTTATWPSLQQNLSWVSFQLFSAMAPTGAYCIAPLNPFKS